MIEKRTYVPDRWIILKLENNDGSELIYKVFGNWFGGFDKGDSWKLSSGISNVIEHEDYYEIHNFSGSIYECRKECIGIHTYGSYILDQFMNEARKSDSYSIEVLDISDVNI